MDLLIYIIYKIFKIIVLALPKFLVKIFLQGLAKFIYLINIEHKKYAKINLDLVYNQSISEDEKYTIIKKSYLNLVYNLYEFIENQNLDLNGFNKKISTKNEHIILDALKSGRKIILITAHYGNWEYGNSYFPLKYAPTTMVGRPMNNKYFNEELNISRTKNNTQMLTKREAGRGLVKAIKNGRILGFVIDQHNGDGIEVEFLKHKVLQADSASRLAVKFDALIIPLFFTMQEFRKYEAEFYKPIDPRNYTSKNNIKELTQIQANIMEQHILKKPEQWFWQHKRFKEFHKDLYDE
jgi:KDO2-lipid IV(A) lauroyltransferase